MVAQEQRARVVIGTTTPRGFESLSPFSVRRVISLSKRQLAQVNSALHPSGVEKSSTYFGKGYGGNVASVRWQVKMCDAI